MLSTNSAGAAVKRFFQIQEERQAFYSRLKKIHEDYAAHLNHEVYGAQMNTVTRGFSELSKEVMSCIAFWKELGLSVIATILSQLQVQEKEKLELTVKILLLQQEGEGKGGEGLEDSATVVDVTWEMRKRLARNEELIASLMDDLKFECESFLVQANDIK